MSTPIPKIKIPKIKMDKKVIIGIVGAVAAIAIIALVGFNWDKVKTMASGLKLPTTKTTDNTKTNGTSDDNTTNGTSNQGTSGSGQSTNNSSSQGSKGTSNQSTNSSPQTGSSVDETLVQSNERMIINFKTQEDKILSVSVSIQDPGYIVYRYGKPGNVELEFPKDKTSTWDKFAFSDTVRGMGVLSSGYCMSYLNFNNDNVYYKVYEEFGEKENKTNIGVWVYEKATNKQYNVKGKPETKIGSLMGLTSIYPKLKKGEGKFNFRGNINSFHFGLNFFNR